MIKIPEDYVYQCLEKFGDGLLKMINTILNVDDICQDCPYFFDGNGSCNK